MYVRTRVCVSLWSAVRWVNRKDVKGDNLFEGGFLGLDNISVFDRSAADKHGIRLQQADATGWMAMYCLNMLAIAIQLAVVNPTYEVRRERACVLSHLAVCI